MFIEKGVRIAPGIEQRLRAVTFVGRELAVSSKIFREPVLERSAEARNLERLGCAGQISFSP